MNKYFDFGRFGKYLTYDLFNAKGRYGLSALITGMFPAVVFVFFQVFSLVFTRSFEPVPNAVKIVSMVSILAVLTIGAPVKLYGFLTEKRTGSDWLMIPASTLEKFISMLIVVCLVLPLTVLLTSAVTDMLLSVAFPYMYGDSLTLSVNRVAEQTFGFFDDNPYLSMTRVGYASTIFNLWEPILLFTLGAMVFKSGKVAKTVLVCFLVASVFSSLAVLFFSEMDLDELIDSMQMTTERAQFIVNAVANVTYLVFFGVVLGGIYYRIKTLKH